MQNEFVTYEQALAIKELGFDEPCFGYYSNSKDHLGEIWYEMPNGGQDYIPVGDVLAPLKSQFFKWARENYGLHAHIDGAFPWFRYHINSEDNEWEGYKELEYVEAENDLISKLIEIVKSK